MQNLLTELQNSVLTISFNRIDKHNAFDDILLADLQIALDSAEKNDSVRVIILKGNGLHFSAGADLNWMKRMAQFSEEENKADARKFAQVMHTLYKITKPTIAMVHGAAFGGGVGLVAACDIAFATPKAKFCFSEVKLGLIPAVISPYIIKAIGARAATSLFLSAEVFDANRAYELQLIQHIIAEDDLLKYTVDYAERMAKLPPLALCDAKSLVRDITNRPIDEELLAITADLIAKKRVSIEGQQALLEFLNKGNYVH